MSALLLNCLEKLLVLLLAMVFAGPLAIAGWLRYSHDASTGTAWLRNATLAGQQIAPAPVPCSAATVFSAGYQSALAKDFDFHFAGREALIRAIDEFDVRVFRAAPPGLLIGGWPLSIIERPYAAEYCLQRVDREKIRPLVDDLRKMQDFCVARGIAFALVITPSKASIYPENLPAAWQRRYRRAPRAYDQLIRLLREENVRFVDGHRLALGLKADSPVPVFPAGGVHWGDQAALATTNELLELLASQGAGVSPLRDYTSRISDEAQGQDADMMGLINVMFPWRYPVMQITVAPTAPARAMHPNLVWVGGSFVWKMLLMMGASSQFSELDFYNYYKVAQYCMADGRLSLVGAPTPAVNFEADVFAADALVVEINEQNIALGAHLREFLHDAFAVLPDPKAAKAAFHYEHTSPPK